MQVPDQALSPLRTVQNGQPPVEFIIDGTEEYRAMQQLDQPGNLALDLRKLQGERHMAFARYAAHRQLSVDLFDAQSSLQLGTASFSLQSLLRQGRSSSDCVVQAPVFDPLEALSVQQSGKPARSMYMAGNSSQAAAVARGILQVRLRSSALCPSTSMGS